MKKYWFKRAKKCFSLNLKTSTILTVLMASLTTAPFQAEGQQVASVGGVGYEESIVAPSMTPYLALCAVTALAIVAVAVRHTGSGHNHNHSH